MGKSLVIKGANFQANGIVTYNETWYVTLGTDNIGSMTSVPTNNSGSAAWSFDDTYNNAVRGKTINQIKFIPATAGTFSIYVLNTRTTSLGIPAATITVSSSDIGQFKRYTIPSITVGSSQYLVFVNPDDSVSMYYSAVSGATFYKRCGFSNTSIVTGYQLLIDVGYREAN